MDLDIKKYTLKLPLFVDPSRRFCKFLKKLDCPEKYPCIVFLQNSKLVLRSDAMPNVQGSNAGSQVYLSLPYVRPTDIAKFSSKFNIANSIAAQNYNAMDISIRILEGNFKGATKYLAVSIVPKTAEIESSLRGFFDSLS